MILWLSSIRAVKPISSLSYFPFFSVKINRHYLHLLQLIKQWFHYKSRLLLFRSDFQSFVLLCLITWDYQDFFLTLTFNILYLCNLCNTLKKNKYCMSLYIIYTAHHIISCCRHNTFRIENDLFLVTWKTNITL
jgi:hypothetical protein